MKATVKFNTVFITSAYSIEDIERVKKYRPKALVLLDDDKNPVYSIGTTCETGSWTKYGIAFAGNTVTGQKVACISVQLNGDMNAEQIREQIRDVFGAALMYGDKIEAQMAKALDEIFDDEASMDSRISIDSDADANGSDEF